MADAFSFPNLLHGHLLNKVHPKPTKLFFRKDRSDLLYEEVNLSCRAVICLIQFIVSTRGRSSKFSQIIQTIGIDNQDKFVGCAATVVMAQKHLQKYIAALPEEDHPELEEKEPEHG